MKDSSRRLRGIIFNCAVFFVVVISASYLIWALRPLILPIVLGILLAYLFRPLKTAFRYRWLPNSLRVAFLFLVLTGGILMGIKFIKDNIPDDREKLEILVRTKYKFNEKFNKFMSIDPASGKGNAFYNLVARDLDPLRKSLNSYLDLSPDQQKAFLNQPDVPEKYYEYFLANTHQKVQSLPLTKGVASKAEGEDASLPVESDKSFLKTAMDILSIWFLMPVVFVCFLLDEGSIAQFFIGLIPNRYFELALTIREEVDGAIGKYLRGISMECGLVALSMAVGFFLIGFPLKMALLIGILSGTATAIPFLGPVVGLAFGLVYALIAEEIHPPIMFVNTDNFALAVIVVNVVVMALDNLVFQPVVLGGAVNLHPLVVILGIMGASILFGMSGVLLAIPAIVVVKVVTQHTFRGLKDYRII